MDLDEPVVQSKSRLGVLDDSFRLVTVSRLRRLSVCCGRKLSIVVRPGLRLLYFGTCHTLEIEVVTRASPM